MGGLLWLATSLAPIATARGLTQAIVVLSLIAGGIAAYGALLSLFGVTGWRETVNSLKPAPPGDLRA